MATSTPNLGMPLVQMGQAGKETTLADALNRADFLIQASIINRTTSAPPGGPAQGDTYIIGAAPTGAWAGSAGKIAGFYGTAWIIVTPEEGWLVYDRGADEFVFYTGTLWKILFKGAGVLNGTATWDPTNLIAGATTTTSVTVTGAALGDLVDLSFSLSLTGLILSGYVSAADTVTVVLYNPTAGAVDLASGTLTARVTKQ